MVSISFGTHFFSRYSKDFLACYKRKGEFFEMTNSEAKTWIPEICFHTELGRQCYPIFSTPTIPPGPVEPLHNRLEIGAISGFDSQDKVSFRIDFVLNALTCKPQAKLQAVDLETNRTFAPLNLSFDSSVLKRIVDEIDLRSLGKRVLSVPLQTIQSHGAKDVCALHVLEIFGQEESPRVLFMRAGERFSMSWAAHSGQASSSSGFTSPDGGPVYWVPWAIAGGAIALCVGAAVYTCGSCKAEIGPVSIGYDCDG